jgi:hypothetical protein
MGRLLGCGGQGSDQAKGETGNGSRNRWASEEWHAKDLKFKIASPVKSRLTIQTTLMQ